MTLGTEPICWQLLLILDLSMLMSKATMLHTSSIAELFAYPQSILFFCRENMPSHFKIKEYCPLVFRNLRERFGIDDLDYKESMTR